MERYSLIYEYIYHKQARIEDDAAHIEQIAYGRETGPYECFECLMAKCRVETADEIFRELIEVLKIERGI